MINFSLWEKHFTKEYRTFIENLNQQADKIPDQNIPEMPDEKSIIITSQEPSLLNKQEKTASKIIENGKECKETFVTLTNEILSNEEKFKAAETGAQIVQSLESGIETLINNLQNVAHFKHINKVAEYSVGAEFRLLPNVVSLASLIDKISTYQSQSIAIETKTAALQLLEKLLTDLQDAVVENESEELKNLKHQIEILKEQISSLSEKNQTFVKNFVLETINGAITGLSSTAAIGKEAAVHGSKAAEAMVIMGPSVGIAGGVVGSVACSINIVNDLNKSDAIKQKQNELHKLLEERKNIKKGSLLHTVIQMKLRQLERQQEDLDFSLATNFLGAFSSLLTTGASVGSVVGTQIVLGVTAGTVLSATGIGGLVVGQLALIVGTAYIVYKNQDAIDNGIDTAGNYISSEVVGFQIETLESKIAEQDRTISEMTKFLEHADDRKNEYVAYYKEKIHQLNKEKDVLHEQLSDANFLEKFIIERQISSIDEKVVSCKGQKKYYKSFFKNLVTFANNSLMESDIAKRQAQTELSDYKGRIKKLEAKKVELTKKSEYIEMAKKIKDMNWQKVEKLESKMESHIAKKLKSDPNALNPIIDFLIEQKFDWEGEGLKKNPGNTLMKYIVKEAA
jgi:hypothetical protein